MRSKVFLNETPDAIRSEEAQMEWEKKCLPVREEYIRRYIESPFETEDEQLRERRFQEMEEEMGLKMPPANFLLEF